MLRKENWALGVISLFPTVTCLLLALQQPSRLNVTLAVIFSAVFVFTIILAVKNTAAARKIT